MLRRVVWQKFTDVSEDHTYRRVSKSKAEKITLCPTYSLLLDPEVGGRIFLRKLIKSTIMHDVTSQNTFKWKTKLRGLSPLANYTCDRLFSAKLVQTFADRPEPLLWQVKICIFNYFIEVSFIKMRSVGLKISKN
jgi:hypothetical protein